MKKFLFFITLLVGLCGSAFAAKTPNITTSGTIELPMIFESPEIQDLTSTNIVLHKTIFDNFEPIYTTLTLNLYQNHKGKLVGTGNFSTYRDDNGATVIESLTVTSLKGNVRNGKVKKGVERGPTFNLEASTSISQVIYKMSVSGEMIKPAFEASFDLDDPEEFATAYYNIAVKVTGLSRSYNYTLENVPVTGNYYFRYSYPSPAEMPRKLKPEKYEYFKVSAPWGEGLVKGTFSDTAGYAVFTLKGPKFQFTATEDGFDGSTFEPEFYTLKTGTGKSSGTHP